MSNSVDLKDTPLCPDQTDNDVNQEDDDVENTHAECKQNENSVEEISESGTTPPASNLKKNENGSKRRVTFPEDGNFVSGFMEPPSPWHEASKCSTEELLLAYRSACDKCSVKPVVRILQQLHTVEKFDVRNEALVLRGEHMNAKHCETMEEVLRRVQFNKLDFEATHLEEEGAIALFDMIEHYESCHILNISYNKIGPRGWQACARMLKKTPCLEQLEARNCTISEQVMPMLGRSLRLGSMLRTLHLEASISSGRPLMILVAAVKMNDILQELFLADNKLMPSDGIQLGNMLKYNTRLQLLDVRNNHLQDVGLSHVCDGLFEQTKGGLQTLVLWNNQITFQSMQNMSKALCSVVSLETINLGHNNLTNEGVHRLKGGLMSNKSLLRIGMQACKISCEGAVALAEFIAESSRLLRIDLRENEIKTGGLMALSLALKVSQSVTRIDLDKDPKKESGVRDFAEQQRRLLQDISNYMQRNRDIAQQREAEEAKKKEELEQAQREAEKETEKETEKQVEVIEKTEENTPETDLETEKDKKEKENDMHQKRLHLNLPLTTNSDTLESPAFVKESDLPIITPPEEEALTGESNSSSSQPDLPVIDLPPSPMVSSKGHPLLAQVPEDLILSSPVSPADQSVNSMSSQSSQSENDTSSESNKLDIKSTSPSDSPTDTQSNSLNLPTGPARSPSPRTARKFKISRVNEKSLNSADSSPTKSSDNSEPTQTSKENSTDNNTDNVPVISLADPSDVVLEENQTTGSEILKEAVQTESPNSSTLDTTEDSANSESSNGNVASSVDRTSSEIDSFSKDDATSKVLDSNAVTTKSDNASTDNVKHSGDSKSAPKSDTENDTARNIDISEPKSEIVDVSKVTETREEKINPNIPENPNNVIPVNGVRTELIDSLKESDVSKLKLEGVQDTEAKDEGHESPDEFEKELSEMLASVPGGFSIDDGAVAASADVEKSIEEFLAEAATE